MRMIRELLKKKAFRTFVWSFLLMFVLPMLVIVTLFSRWESTTEEGLKTSTQLVLEQYKSSIDGQLLNVKRIGDNLVTDDRVLFFSNAVNPSQYLSSSISFETIRSLAQEMSRLGVLNDNLGSCYLYFARSGKIIGNTVMDAPNYYLYRLGPMFSTSDAWEGFLLGGSNGFVSYEQDGRRALHYIRTLMRGGEPSVVVVMEINDAFLKRYASELHSRGMELTLFSAEGALLFSTQEDVSFTLPREASAGVAAVETSQGTLYLGISQSGDTGCYYVTSAPQDVFMAKLNTMRRLSTALMALILLAGVMLSLYLAKRRYTPIHALRSAVEGNARFTADNGDDFAYLMEVVDSMKDERLSISKRLRHSRQTMEHFVLEHLLLGTYATLPAMQEQLLALDIAFDSDAFILAALRIDAIAEPEDEAISREDDENLMRFVLCNIFGELLAAYSAQTVEIGDLVYVLMCVESATEPPYAKIADTLREGRRIVVENFHISLSLAASECVESLYEIRTASAAVRDALYERSGENDLLLYLWESPRRPDDAQRYELVERAAHKLTQLVQAGDAKGATAQLNALRQSCAGLPSWTVRMVCTGVLTECLPALLPRGDEAERKQALGQLRSYQESPPRNEFAALEELLASLQALFPLPDDKSRGPELCRRAQEFIEANYASNFMSIAYVADHLGITAGYASALFKRYTGQAMLDVINQTRIRHAKALLEGTAMGMNEIAEKVGYLNSSTFIRAFKKSEGITPGQYRLSRGKE